ncbi:hypothetical protein WDU94_013868, partial [Cyamophila willieti]
IEKVPACLARFRRNKIGISGDIEKAFLQIGVSKKDRDVLRFLWLNEKGQLVTYRHCRLVFGVSPSPFLLESCIKLHLEETLKLCEKGEAWYPIEYVERLAESFYVDNSLTSFENLDDAREFMVVASSIMKERQFNLRGWELSYDSSNEPTNVLGMLWKKDEDVLSVNVDSLMSMDIVKVTKRVILSAAHRIYDPIGIISPFALIPKLLLQETWEDKLGWNEEVSADIQTRFANWMDEVPSIAEIKIPRCITSLNLSESNISINVFADASKSAYATVIFLRVELVGNVTIQLLASRARVSPTSKTKDGITIPRLELLAALIAARLYRTVVEDYKFSGVSTTFWTDSTTVLTWIQKHDQWNVFVMNRIKEIRSLSLGESCEWRHVSGTMNPADLPSRGCKMQKLLKDSWWEGPAWLRESPENWPQPNMEVDEEEVSKERKKTVVSSMVNSSTEYMPKDWYCTYFSDFKKLVRFVGWIYRFYFNCKVKEGNRMVGELSAKEYVPAEQKVLLWIQKESFEDVSDPKLKSLLPFTDENGLIRIKTQVSNREDSVDFCHPVVLPTSHPVVQRIIANVHKENCHAGTQLLTAILRKQYWVIGGRRAVRAVVSSCVTCKRYLAKRLEVTPTPLPEGRVRDARVFEVTGVDLAGPLYIRADDKGTKKVWICLFTCAIYRAVRLELVCSLSTDSFLQAFRRFCSKQGRPLVMWSDNGSNFFGYQSASEKLDWEAIAKYSSAKKIEWRFNPPTGAWWGGFWERLIGLMKVLLRRILGRSSLNYEEMSTLLCDCESVINARPLTYMSDNPRDLAVLTPAMFLHDIEETGVPEYDLIDASNLRQHFKHRTDLKKQLRERFKLEY